MLLLRCSATERAVQPSFQECSVSHLDRFSCCTINYFYQKAEMLTKLILCYFVQQKLNGLQIGDFLLL